MQGKKIIVGLSGGVDSAVAAYQLTHAGHTVHGLFMQNWDDKDNHCSNAVDMQDAIHICNKLNLPFAAVNFSQAYMKKVFSCMLEDLNRGYTPNPDILCNQEIKFKVLLEYVLAQQADFLATGHYAQISIFHGQPALACAVDENKDQTYFLCRLPKTALQHILFPIGRLQKPQVRQIAQSVALKNAHKKDSTGICFIGERKFQDFISNYLLDKPGEILDTYGRVIGKHRGLFYYTIGQRKGLHIGGKLGYAEKPWFVIHKDKTTNQLHVAQGADNPALFKQILIANRLHYLVEQDCLSTSFSAQARIRHRQALQNVKIIIDGDQLQAIFTQPQRAITPGQSIAIYQKNICIMSAIIQHAGPK